MKKLISLIALSILVFSCGSSENEGFQLYGKLHEIMMGQQLQGRIALANLKVNDRLYGIGAVEGLDGEITISAGRLYMTQIRDGKMVTSEAYEGQAALLGIDYVKDWQQPILISAANMEELSKKIGQSNYSDNVSVFTLAGIFDEVTYHVINGPGASSADHEAYKAAGITKTDKNVSGIIIGFYSTELGGELMHRGSNVHMHFIPSNERITGHVDAIKVTNIGLKMSFNNE